MILRALLVALLIMTHGWSLASDSRAVIARIGHVAVEIPAGLNGPHRSFPNQQAELDVYVSGKDMPPALLQLTLITSPRARVDLSEKDKSEAASHFLLGFLREFSKNVSGWTSSQFETVRLGAHAGVRAKWSGSFHNIPTTGVMYLIVIGKESYCFHAYGRADVPNVTLAASIRAIDALRMETRPLGQ